MMGLWMAYAIAITAMLYLAAAAGEQLLWIWRGPRRAAWMAAVVGAIAIPAFIPLWQGADRQAPIVSRSTPPLRSQDLTTTPPVSAPARFVSAHSARPLSLTA